MKFKVGDRVRLLSYDSACIFKENERSKGNCPLYIDMLMEKFFNKSYEISSKDYDEDIGTMYKLSGVDNWYFSDYMLANVVFHKE